MLCGPIWMGSTECCLLLSLSTGMDLARLSCSVARDAGGKLNAQTVRDVDRSDD